MLWRRPPEHATGRHPPGHVALDQAKAIAVRLLTPSSVARRLAGAVGRAEEHLLDARPYGAPTTPRPL